MRRLHLTRHARLLGNGVDLTRFDPARFARRRARRAPRASSASTDDDIVVGAVGRLVAEKGYPELFDAVDALPATGTGSSSSAATTPTSPTRSRRRRRRGPAHAGVVFLGQRDDVDRCYAAMDVFVLASHREGFPRAAMEAAAMGLPVVATDVRGCREVVDAGDHRRARPRARPGRARRGARRPRDDPAAGPMSAAPPAAGARRTSTSARVVETVLETYREVAARKGVDLAGL